jgi:hypothetical protein
VIATRDVATTSQVQGSTLAVRITIAPDDTSIQVGHRVGEP